jgi:hypothetical protein
VPSAKCAWAASNWRHRDAFHESDTSRVHAGLCLALLAAVLTGCAARSTQPVTLEVPRFEPGQCVSPLGSGLVEGSNVCCGFLVFTGPCPYQIGLAFFADPTQQPSTSCMAQMGEPAFQ